MEILALFSYVLTGLVLHRNEGHFSNSVFFYTLVFLVCVAFGLARFGRQKLEVLPRVLSAYGVLAFAYKLSQGHRILYGAQGTALHSVYLLTIAGFWLSLPIAAMMIPRRLTGIYLRAFAALCGVSSAIWAAAACLVPAASPNPRIDVFVNLDLGVRFLLQGLNPYTQQYPNLYGNLFTYASGMFYPPGALFCLLPFRLALGDIRYGYVASLFVFAAFAWQCGKRIPDSRWKWIFALLALSFPVNLFVIEQAWVDLLLTAQFVLTLWLLKLRKPLWVAAVLGMTFATKQYGFIITGLGLLVVLREFGRGVFLRAAAISAAVAAVIILPFALADWTAFKTFTITNHLAGGLREDSYSMMVYLHHKLHWDMPSALESALTLFGILAGAWVVWRSPRQKLAPAYAMGCWFAYGFAFIFGKQAFCNYYQLLAGFILVYFALSVEPAHEAS